jgi:hypothetical protein
MGESSRHNVKTLGDTTNNHRLLAYPTQAVGEAKVTQEVKFTSPGSLEQFQHSHIPLDGVELILSVLTC